MTKIPKPKPRPYNPEWDYIVRVGELPLLNGLASHLVISDHDPEGKQLWEINGMATGPDNQPKAVGWPWDSSDKIKMYFDTGPKSRFGDKIRNQRAVRWGSLDDINDFRRKAHATAGHINQLDLGYRLDTQNSNAGVGELLRSDNINPRELFRHGGFQGAVPGYLHRLLEPGLY